MQPYSLVLFGLILASPMLANVTWSNPGTAANSIPANNGAGRICRVQSGGNFFVGVATNGICSYVNGSSTTSSNNFLVADGLGKWESPSLPNPVEVGNLNFAPTRVCRPTLHNQEMATGYTLGSPVQCYLPTSNGPLVTPHFEVLFPFDTSSTMHVLHNGLCLTTRTTLANAVVFQGCSAATADQWRLAPATNGFSLESVGTPGSCVAQGAVGTFPVTFQAARLVSCATAPILTLAHYGVRALRIRDTAANLTFARNNAALNAGAGATFRSTLNDVAEAFELLTLNEASRRLSAISYNVYLLPDDQFPLLRQNDRAE